MSETKNLKDKVKSIFVKDGKINLNRIISYSLIIVIIMIMITAQNKLIEIYKPLFVLFLILPFFVTIENKKINVEISRLSIIWLILVIYFGVSIFYSIEIHDTLYNLVVYSFGFLFLIHKFNINFYEKLIKAIEYATIFCAVTIVLSAIFPEGFATVVNWFKIEVEDVYDSATNGYAAGILFEKARAAFVMNIGIAIVTSTMLVKKEYNKNNILKLILLFLALLLTGKRMLTAIGIFIILLLIILISKKTKKTYKNLATAICLSAIVIGIICLIFPRVGLVFQRMTNIGNTIGGREVFWNIAGEMISDSPVIGKGIGTYNAYLDDIGFTYYGDSWTSHAHNSYIQIFAETGIIGLSLMIFAIGYTLIRTIILIVKKYKKPTNEYEIERKRQLYISLAIQILFCIYALTGNPFHKFQELYIYIIFISILNCKLYKKMEEKNE